MSATASPAAPVFSYAQAAKGRSPAPSAPPTTKDGSSDQSIKPMSISDASVSEPTPKSPRSKSRSESKDVESRLPNQDSSSVAKEADMKEHSDSLQTPESIKPVAQSEPSPSYSAEDASTAEKAVSQINVHNESWEKSSQASNSAEKSFPAEKDKSKEIEDDWEKVSIPSVAADKEKEFKAAPLPAVNIWEQRREAQAAKKRDVVVQRPSPITSSAPASRPKAASEDAVRKTVNKNAAEKDTSPASKKVGEALKVAERKDGSTAQPSRSVSAQNERGEPPSVADAKLWPTPETATVDDRRKSSIVDKADVKLNGSKGHTNKWISVPFVPTAKFETQLPPSAARRGGRSGPRGGRDGTGRGGHSHTGEKHDSATSPPVPKQPVENERGRKSEGNRGARASSLPSSHRRPSSHEGTNTFRKPAIPQPKEESSVEPPVSASAKPDSLRINDAPAPMQEQSQPSSHHDEANATVGHDQAITVAPEQVADHSRIVVSENIPKPSYGNDRAKAPTQHVTRPNGESARERGIRRDFNREKSDQVRESREKVESWRDREPSGDSNRREQRSDRGRGGYRGRGNHSYNSFPTAPFTAPIPQNGFEAPKQSPSHESRSRQTSQPFNATNQPPRNNPRSQSIPVGMMHQGYYNYHAGMHPAVSPIQTDMTQYGYPGQVMQPGIMSAMSYNEPLTSYAVLSMVMTQVEYYFSIDNLCKDLFLRKHMDSQGFVPLSIVANFKRIKTLTEEHGTMDTLRYVCQQVKSVEYVMGDDGSEKLRRRDGWQDFVLPMEERLQLARNDGPSQSERQQRMPSVQPFPGSTPFHPAPLTHPVPSISNVNGMYAATSPVPFTPIPQVDGQTGDRFVSATQTQEPVRRESTISPTSQEAVSLRSPSTAQKYPGLTNGHVRHSSRGFNEDNTFPDEAIPNINIFMRDTAQNGDASTTLPAVSRVLSNESNTSRDSRVLGLRGSAANPEQLARLQGLTFGSSQTSVSDDTPVFFTKDGQQTQMPPIQPGHFYHTYQSLYDTSMQQKEHGVDGALEPMYMFWSNFLVDKFNAGMYQEFKTLAHESKDQDESGIQHLMKYYQNVLRSAPPMPERVAVDVVDVLRAETDESKPTFKLLRKAWRDGALNLKTRKRIGDILTEQEKAEFDRGG